MDAVLVAEPMVRLGCFAAVLGACAIGECWAPRRAVAAARAVRWPANLSVAALNQVLTRVVLPVSAVLLAATQQQGGGLFARLDWPGWIELALAVVLLDLAIYLQHVMYHALPLLWRFHRMHHADVVFDVTTGVRFHPLSVLLSAAIKLMAVYLIAPAPLAVMIFEVLLNATSLFNHSNLAIPAGVERALRRVVVTPDMHRVHHSSDPAEMNHNFGFNFPWWDRLFGTYLAQPALGHERMRIGLPGFRAGREQRLGRMLTQPFREAA